MNMARVTDTTITTAHDWTEYFTIPQGNQTGLEVISESSLF